MQSKRNANTITKKPQPFADCFKKMETYIIALSQARMNSISLREIKNLYKDIIDALKKNHGNSPLKQLIQVITAEITCRYFANQMVIDNMIADEKTMKFQQIAYETFDEESPKLMTIMANNNYPREFADYPHYVFYALNACTADCINALTTANQEFGKKILQLLQIQKATNNFIKTRKNSLELIDIHNMLLTVSQAYAFDLYELQQKKPDGINLGKLAVFLDSKKVETIQNNFIQALKSKHKNAQYNADEKCALLQLDAIRFRITLQQGNISPNETLELIRNYQLDKFSEFFRTISTLQTGYINEWLPRISLSNKHYCDSLNYIHELIVSIEKELLKHSHDHSETLEKGETLNPVESSLTRLTRFINIFYALDIVRQHGGDDMCMQKILDSADNTALGLADSINDQELNAALNKDQPASCIIQLEEIPPLTSQQLMEKGENLLEELKQAFINVKKCNQENKELKLAHVKKLAEVSTTIADFYNHTSEKNNMHPLIYICLGYLLLWKANDKLFPLVKKDFYNVIEILLKRMINIPVNTWPEHYKQQDKHLIFILSMVATYFMENFPAEPSSRLLSLQKLNQQAIDRWLTRTDEGNDLVNMTAYMLAGKCCYMESLMEFQKDKHMLSFFNKLTFETLQKTVVNLQGESQEMQCIKHWYALQMMRVIISRMMNNNDINLYNNSIKMIKDFDGEIYIDFIEKLNTDDILHDEDMQLPGKSMGINIYRLFIQHMNVSMSESKDILCSDNLMEFKDFSTAHPGSIALYELLTLRLEFLLLHKRFYSLPVCQKLFSDCENILTDNKKLHDEAALLITSINEKRKKENEINSTPTNATNKMPKRKKRKPAINLHKPDNNKPDVATQAIQPEPIKTPKIYQECHFPDYLIKIFDKLPDDVYIVGGGLRAILTNSGTYDIDVLTTTPMKTIQKLFSWADDQQEYEGEFIPAKNPIFRIYSTEIDIDFTRLADAEDFDGEPEHIQHATGLSIIRPSNDLAKNIRSRILTCDSVLLKYENNPLSIYLLIDPHNGLQHIIDHEIHFNILDKNKSLAENIRANMEKFPCVIFKIIRLIARENYTISDEVKAVILSNLDVLANENPETIYHHLNKTLSEDNHEMVLILLKEFSVLQHAFNLTNEKAAVLLQTLKLMNTNPEISNDPLARWFVLLNAFINHNQQFILPKNLYRYNNDFFCLAVRIFGVWSNDVTALWNLNRLYYYKAHGHDVLVSCFSPESCATVEKLQCYYKNIATPSLYQSQQVMFAPKSRNNNAVVCEGVSVKNTL